MRDHGAAVEIYRSQRLIVASKAGPAQSGDFALSFLKAWSPSAVPA